MNFPVSRPQTGSLNPALLDKLPTQSNQTNQTPQATSQRSVQNSQANQSLQPQDNLSATLQHARPKEMGANKSASQPVSVAFPSLQPGVQPSGQNQAGFEPVQTVVRMDLPQNSPAIERAQLELPDTQQTGVTHADTPGISRMQAAAQNIAIIDSTRFQLGHTGANIGRLVKEVQESNENIQRDENQIAQIQARILDQTQTQQALTAVASQIISPNSDAYFCGQAQTGKLAALNQHLSAAGLSMNVDAQGQVSYLADNQPVSKQEFQTKLTSFLSQNRTGIEQDRAQIVVLQDSREQHIQESQTITDALANERETHAQNLKLYEQQLDQLRTRSLPDLIQLKADPEFWNNQPESVRQMIDDLISRGNQEIQQAPAFIARQRDVLKQADTVMTESRQFISQVRQNAQATARFLDQLNDMLKRLDKDQAQIQQAAGLSPETVELIAEADHLAATLTLAAQPSSPDSAELISETLQTLEKLSSQLRISQREQLNNQSVQARIQQTYLEQSRANLQYHLDKLKALSQHSN